MRKSAPATARRTQTKLKVVRRGRPRKKPVRALEPIAAPIADRVQREMIDEYGELDRQVQMFAPMQARYEVLKKAIKSWFDSAPSDAEASVEGASYLLHISARERERKVRSMKQLCNEIGIDELLALVSVSLGPLEDLIGKQRVAALVTDERTGSRRIKAVAKHPSAPPAA
jgi:hypothetical protein